MLMVGYKKVLVQGFAALLFFVLLAGAYVVSVNSVFGKPESVESSLKKSGVYSKLASYAVDRAAASTSTTSGSVSLDNPKVKALANSVFSQQLVQQNAETFINSNYKWLDGTTTTPQFTLDFNAAKTDFATKVGQTVLDYLTGLPVCTNQQLVQLKSAPSLDPLAIPCRPSTVQPRAEANRVAAQILTSNFLSQPTLTAETLKLNDQTTPSRPYYVQLAQAPKLYRLTQALPLILGIVAVLLSLAVIFIAPIRRRGVRRVGLTFVTVGAILVATKFISDNLFNRLQENVFKTSDITDVQKPLLDAAHQLQKQLVMTDLYLGIGFVIIGLLLVFAYFKMRASDKAGPRTPAVADTSPTIDREPVQAPAPVAAPQQPIQTAPAQNSPPVAPTLARPAKGPTMDIAVPPKPKPQPKPPTAKPAVVRRPPRARGRLIQ